MSETKTYRLDAQQDFIEKQSNAKPLHALCEFIWNALDADADRVDISITSGETGIQKIIIQDNGDGISHADATEQFQNLGGSWKKSKRVTKRKQRFLHGCEGKGRLQGFSLGNVLDWHIVHYNKISQKFEEFNIFILKSDMNTVKITSPTECDIKKSGVTVKITEFDKDLAVLKAQNAVQPLSEMLALYLNNYTDIAINYDGEPIDTSRAIKNVKTFKIPSGHFEGKEFEFNLELIEWNAATDKKLYLCTSQGFPFFPVPSKFKVGGFKFSGYLKSNFIEKLNNEGRLGLVEMEPVLGEKIECAKNLIKIHFRDRAAEEAKSLVKQWKEDDIYPYKTSPQNNIEDVEQTVFNILAVNVNDFLPDFEIASKKQKALHLRLLKQAVEESPEDLQVILNEVLDLPKQKQIELAKLLQETSLSTIISASKMIADRLRFITGLEEILFNPNIKKHLKERSQLHKILEDHTWIFGEEFHLSLSDKGLTEVLKKHRKAINGSDFVVDEPVKRVDGTHGIVDLMLTREIKTNRSDELEHLIIELKAPSVKIGQNETSQLESYAFAVAEDERFNAVNVKWNFWLVSNNINKIAERRTRIANLPKGAIYRSEDGNVTLWVKTWGEIIQDNKARLKFIQEKLEYQIDKDDALKHLQETYKTLIEGTKVGDAINKTLKE